MNSVKYSKSSNIEVERKHKPYWKRKDMNNSPFPLPNVPLLKFLEENNKKSNFIKLANINLNDILKDNFKNTLENIISKLTTSTQEKSDQNTNEEYVDIPREALLNIMKHGLIYNMSAPVVNFLISLNNLNFTNKIRKKEDDYDYDDLIIFFLKKICQNFEKFDDFLDTMTLLSRYLSKNFLINILDDNDICKKLDNQDSKQKEKKENDDKSQLNSCINIEKESSSISNKISNYNTIELTSTINEGIFDTLIKYIYCSVRYEIFCLYPIFSQILSIFCKTNSYPANEIILNLLLIYKIDISTPSINSYIDYLCRNNYLEECHEIISLLIKYSPEYTLPGKIIHYLRNKYGENPKEEQNIEKENNPINGNFKLNCEKSLIYYGINIVSFGIYLKYLCKNDYFDTALFYYEQLNKSKCLKDEVIYNLLLNACGKKLDIKNLHKIYMDMIKNNIKPNIITFNTIIDAFVRNKNTEKAFKIFNEILDNKIVPDNFTLSTLFKGINKPEHTVYLNQGVNIINKNLFPIDAIIINVLLDSCIKLKEEKNFIEIFDNLINKKYKNIKPDLITYNTYIKGCSKFKLYENAEIAFNHLISHSGENNIYPNDVTFNSLIDMYISQKNMDKVLQTVNLMQQYNIIPDNYTYTTIIKGLNKNNFFNNKNNINSDDNDINSNFLENFQLQTCNELNLVFNLFNNIIQIIKPNEILYNCIMDACLRFNQIDKMLQIYDQMKKSNIQPSSITCGIMIKAYGMKGDIKSAMNIYYQMKKDKIKISDVTYGCLINACIKNNELQKAFELYEALKEESFEMNTILYTTLIKAYAKQKDLKKVVEIFDAMKKTTNSKPNNFTYNSMIDCCIKCNNISLAYDYFKEMLNDVNNTSENNSIRPDLVTFSTLIKGEINNKCFGNARKLLMKLLDFDYIKLDCILLNTLLDGCDKCGCYGEAMEIFTIFKNKNIPCNMMTYSILLKILGKLNDFDNSFKLLNEMKDNDIKLNLIISTCFIKTCFNTNHIVEGLNLFKELPQYKIYPDNIAYTTMISGIIHNIQTGDYSDELISIVKKSIEDKIHLNKKIYFKSLYYLNLLDHKDKVESLTEYLKEKNIISLYQDNVMYSSNSKIEEISEKKDNKSSSPISNSCKSESNESTNNKTMNSNLTNFNTPGYGFLNTINALNRCYYQKYCMNKNGEEKSSNKETSVSYTGGESCKSYKKETSLKEIFDNNLSYPFVYKNKTMSIFDFAKTDYKENSEKENKTDLSEEKGNSC